MAKIPLLLLLAAIGSAAPQDSAGGTAIFENRCAGCHGADGNGGEFGPAIAVRVAARNDAELASFLRTGAPNRGMPAFFRSPIPK